MSLQHQDLWEDEGSDDWLSFLELAQWKVLTCIGVWLGRTVTGHLVPVSLCLLLHDEGRSCRGTQTLGWAP